MRIIGQSNRYADITISVSLSGCIHLQQEAELLHIGSRFHGSGTQQNKQADNLQYVWLSTGVTVLGAFQLSQQGDVANWATLYESFPPAVGSDMYLVVGLPNVFVIMKHTTKDGAPKILKTCSYPLTRGGIVTRIYPDLAVLAITAEGIECKS